MDKNMMFEWDDFIKDMTPEQRDDFRPLSETARFEAFKYWMRTEGLHINYSFKN